MSRPSSYPTVPSMPAAIVRAQEERPTVRVSPPPTPTARTRLANRLMRLAAEVRFGHAHDDNMARIGEMLDGLGVQ
jgi:hypothetical protein